MKRVRYQVWVCSCNMMVVDMDGPDDVKSIELFVNLLCSSTERDLPN